MESGALGADEAGSGRYGTGRIGAGRIGAGKIGSGRDRERTEESVALLFALPLLL
jgi:hypothetical protein